MNIPAGDQVLQELLSGNRRYAAGKAIHPHQTAARCKEIAGGQHPVAAVVACADSRVAPEIVFDQGLGDLFVVRVAGNVLGDAVTGSLEYAAEHLGVPLVVVLGHTRCGAVEAAVGGGVFHGHLSGLIDAIRPAVDEVRGSAGDLVDLAVRANVRRGVGQLTSSRPILYDLVDRGALKVVGAIYDLDSRGVEVLP